MRILVIRFSSIGDITLTSPILKLLSEELPGSEIHFLVKKNFLEAIKSNARLQKVHILKKNIGETVKELRGERFDYVLDLQNNLKSKRIGLQLQKPYSTFPKRNIQKWLMVHFKLRMTISHVVERYALALRPLLPQVSNSRLELEFFLTEEDQQKADSLIQAAPFSGVPPYGVALGATYRTKKWIPSYFIELINRYQKPVILLGGPDDSDTAQQISEELKVPYLNTAGLAALPTSAALLQRCRFVITHDTGLMHIAAALKIPTLTLWGNTIPEFGMTPYNALFEIIENKGLRCRPCSKLGFSTCPRRHFKCMQEITPQIVLNAILNFETRYNL
jgi:ADP-heptose:LPS heptosyltransferase